MILVTANVGVSCGFFTVKATLFFCHAFNVKQQQSDGLFALAVTSLLDYVLQRLQNGGPRHSQYKLPRGEIVTEN